MTTTTQRIPAVAMDILIRELYLARVEKRLEQETDRAFMAWSATRKDLPGHKWEHVTDPLYHRWQDMERALALVRCI